MSDLRNNNGSNSEVTKINSLETLPSAEPNVWSHLLSLLDDKSVANLSKASIFFQANTELQRRARLKKRMSLYLASGPIAAGFYHSVALKSNGEVYVFGANGCGQLGLGYEPDQRTPVKILGIDKIKGVAARGEHTLLLTENGEVYVFGANGCGQLGLGDKPRQRTPVKLLGIDKIKSITAGYNHTLLLTENGEVYVFGSNEYGQLGLGDEPDQRTPVKIPKIDKIISMTAGERHTLLLTENGEVYSFGFNFYGELGLGHTDNQRTPVKIPEIDKIKSMVAGDTHTLLLTVNGEVYSFGRNKYGQLGFGPTNRQLRPVKIEFIDKIKYMTAEVMRTLLLTENGEVYVFGINNSGQLGLGHMNQELTRVKIPRIDEIKSMTAGVEHTLLLTENGEVYSFGKNNKGQLGLNKRITATPIKIPSLRLFMLPHYRLSALSIAVESILNNFIADYIKYPNAQNKLRLSLDSADVQSRVIDRLEKYADINLDQKITRKNIVHYILKHQYDVVQKFLCFESISKACDFLLISIAFDAHKNSQDRGIALFIIILNQLISHPKFGGANENHKMADEHLFKNNKWNSFENMIDAMRDEIVEIYTASTSTMTKNNFNARKAEFQHKRLNK